MTNQASSLLLQLPAEIRSLIYTHFFSGIIQVYPGLGKDHDPETQSKIRLLGTCRQIRFEATPILYSICTFEIDYLPHINRLIHGGGARYRDIRSIRLLVASMVHLIGDDEARSALRLVRFEGLKEIRVEGRLPSDQRAALQSLEWVKRPVRLVFEDY